MSEERFEEIIEQAADRVDCSLSKVWRDHPSLRIASRSLSIITGAGLMASAIPLSRRGKKTAAKVCLVSGGVILAAEAGMALLLKEEK